jgi:hypothetical protein
MSTIKVDDITGKSSTGLSIHLSSSTPGSPVEGQIYYNTTTNKLMLYNGSAWLSIIDSSTTQASSATTIQSFSYTGSDQDWVAPSNVSLIRVSLWGAGGGGDGADGGDGYGGAGGFVSGILSVTPGAAYKIVVGGGGQGGANDNNLSPAQAYAGSGGGYEDPAGGGLSGIFSGSGAIFGGTNNAVPQITIGDARHLMIAGGGGGGDPGDPAGKGGGGVNGLHGGQGFNATRNCGDGGSDVGPGASSGDLSGFLLGGDGNAHYSSTSARWVGGGGGGFYGGGSGDQADTPGGGGSSYTGTATNVISDGANVASNTTVSWGIGPSGIFDGLWISRPDNYIPGKGGVYNVTTDSGVGNTTYAGGGYHGAVIISYNIITYS